MRASTSRALPSKTFSTAFALCPCQAPNGNTTRKSGLRVERLGFRVPSLSEPSSLAVNDKSNASAVLLLLLPVLAARNMVTEVAAGNGSLCLPQ